MVKPSFISIDTRTLTFAHSPDPDDAFMFYGFASGGVSLPGYTVQPHIEDIERLNARALKGDFEITAVSAHAYAYCSQRYWILSCGASVGRGYGPILVSKKGIPHPLPPATTSLAGVRQRLSGRRERASRTEGTGAREGWRVALPGKWTTSALVFDLWLAENRELKVEKVVLPFDKILPAIARGEVDAGLVIHEGQLSYADHGLEKVWDAGAWWKKKTGLPLPLGLDVVRSDLGMGLAQEIDVALRKSILYAQAHSKEAVAYAQQYSRGMDRSLVKRFIGMYVNEDTLTQGKDVQDGLEQLYDQAHAVGLIPYKPDLTFI